MVKKRKPLFLMDARRIEEARSGREVVILFDAKDIIVPKQGDMFPAFVVQTPRRGIYRARGSVLIRRVERQKEGVVQVIVRHWPAGWIPK